MRARAATIVLLATCAVACASPPPRVDLVEALADAEVFTETGLIDVGEPDARRHLQEGWLAGDEHWAQRPDESFVWASGGVAGFRFFVFEERDLAMALRARPDPLGGIGRFGVEVNGQRLAPLEVGDGWQDYRVTLPRQLLVAGENTVRLLFFDVASGAAGDRRLAVDRIEFFRTRVTYPVRREIGAPALIVPYLSGVWFTLRTAPGDLLRVAELRPYGPHPDGEEPGALEIVVETPSGQERMRAEPGAGVSVPLPPDAVRIGLFAVPGGNAVRRDPDRRIEEAVGLLLRRPRIVGDGR